MQGQFSGHIVGPSTVLQEETWQFGQLCHNLHLLGSRVRQLGQQILLKTSRRFLRRHSGQAERRTLASFQKDQPSGLATSYALKAKSAPWLESKTGLPVLDIRRLFALELTKKPSGIATQFESRGQSPSQQLAFSP